MCVCVCKHVCCVLCVCVHVCISVRWFSIDAEAEFPFSCGKKKTCLPTLRFLRLTCWLLMWPKQVEQQLMLDYDDGYCYRPLQRGQQQRPGGHWGSGGAWQAGLTNWANLTLQICTKTLSESSFFFVRLSLVVCAECVWLRYWGVEVGARQTRICISCQVITWWWATNKPLTVARHQFKRCSN